MTYGSPTPTLDALAVATLRQPIEAPIRLVIVDDQRLKEHSAHWEAGAKQNFDTGLYTAYTVLYIRVSDYGPKPKVGKHLVLDKGTNRQRSYTILNCEEEAGVYRISMERTRQ